MLPICHKAPEWRETANSGWPTPRFSLASDPKQRNQGGVMSKSVWLMSAGIVGLAAAPAYAQDNSTPTGQASPTQQAGQVGQPAAPPTDKEASRSSSPPSSARRCSGRADRRLRHLCPVAAEFGRDRHPPVEPARAVAARLLDRHRGERLGPHPRHRHGRRQSRLESSVAVFIDGV